MTIDKQALRNSALEMIRVLGYIASFESEDIDGDDLELRFETEGGFDTGCTISIVSQCQDAADVMQQLLNELEAAQKMLAEQPGKKRLIGWRMEDYTDETADPALAKNWAAAVGVLPIFEGDVNTKLTAAGISIKGSE